MEGIKRRAHASRPSFASEDNVMLKQAWETHSADSHYIDVKPILLVVEDILNLAAPVIHSVIHVILSISISIVAVFFMFFMVKFIFNF